MQKCIKMRQWMGTGVLGQCLLHQFCYILTTCLVCPSLHCGEIFPRPATKLLVRDSYRDGYNDQK